MLTGETTRSRHSCGRRESIEKWLHVFIGAIESGAEVLCPRVRVWCDAKNIRGTIESATEDAGL